MVWPGGSQPHHLPAHTVSSQDQEARTITCLPPYQVQRQTSPTVLFLLKDFHKKVQNIIVKRLTDTSRWLIWLKSIWLYPRASKGMEWSISYSQPPVYQLAISLIIINCVSYTETARQNNSHLLWIRLKIQYRYVETLSNLIQGF